MKKVSATFLKSVKTRQLHIVSGSRVTVTYLPNSCWFTVANSFEKYSFFLFFFEWLSCVPGEFLTVYRLICVYYRLRDLLLLTALSSCFSG